MSNTPVFAVFYDPALGRVTKIVRQGGIENDSEENIKKGLMEHMPVGGAVVFIPEHRAEDVSVIMAGLGIEYP